MGWSGGTYTKGNAGSGGWAGDASLGIGIEASRHDTQDNDFATGINNCLTKDGQNTPTANLPMGGYKHTGVGNATAADEYLSYGQLLDVTKAVTTSGTQPNYTITVTPAPSAYVTGQVFVVRPHDTYRPNAGATLNVNGLGAKPLKVTRYLSVTRDIWEYEFNERGVYYVAYDGTDDAFRVLNPTFGGQATTFTPSVSSNTGTCTLNPTSNDNWYQFVNENLVKVHYQVNFNLSGSSSSFVEASLPIQASSSEANSIGIGYASSAAGYTGAGSPGVSAVIAGSTNLRFLRNDNTNWAIDSSFLIYGTILYTML